MVKSRPLLSCIMLSVAWLVTGGASDDRDGFLSPGEFNVPAVLEPAPHRADPRYEADRKIFRTTRML